MTFKKMLAARKLKARLAQIEFRNAKFWITVGCGVVSLLAIALATIVLLSAFKRAISSSRAEIENLQFTVYVTPLILAAVWTLCVWLIRSSDNWKKTTGDVLLVAQLSALAGLLIGIGFQLEPIVRSLGQNTEPGPVFQIQVNPLRAIGAIVSYSALIGFPLCFTAVALGRLKKAFWSRLVVTWSAVALALSISDTSVHLATYLIVPGLYRISTSINSLMFSFLSNITGGSVVALLVTIALGRFKSLSPKVTGLQSPNVLTLLRRTAFIFLVGVSIAGLGLSAIYFLLIYKIPENVVIQLEKWDSLTLEYKEPFLSEASDFDRETTFRMLAASKHVSFRISENVLYEEIPVCSVEGECPTLSFRKLFVGLNAISSLDADKLANEISNPRVWSNDVSIADVRKIVVTGVREVHFARSGPLNIDQYTALSLPFDTPIRFDWVRYSDSFFSVLAAEADQRNDGEEVEDGEVLAVRGNDIGLEGTLNNPTLIAFSPKFEFDYLDVESTQGASVVQAIRDIEVSVVNGSGETIPLIQMNNESVTVRPNGSSLEVLVPALELRFLGEYGGAISVSESDSINIRQPLFSMMRIGTITAEYSKLQSVKLVGTIKVNNMIVPIDIGDSVFVGGANLYLIDEDRGSLQLVGFSPYVAINQKSLNRTVASLVPSEVFGAIIGSSLAFLFSYYASSRWRREKGNSGQL